MAKDILGMYSNNSSPKKSSKGNSMVSGGGMPNERDVMNYCPPQIPGWSPFASMRPGLGGSVRKAGTQGGGGANGDGAGGNVGLGGDKPSMGTNRKG